MVKTSSPLCHLGFSPSLSLLTPSKIEQPPCPLHFTPSPPDIISHSDPLLLSPTSSPLSLHHRSLKQQDGDVTIHFHKSSSRSMKHSPGESYTLTKSSETFFRAFGPKSPYKVGAKFKLVDKAGQDHLPRKLRPRSGKVTSNPKNVKKSCQQGPQGTSQ